jgi:hypothetical protein
MNETYESLRKFHIREAERETRSRRWRRVRQELYVFLVASALIAAVAWAVGQKWIP